MGLIQNFSLKGKSVILKFYGRCLRDQESCFNMIEIIAVYFVNVVLRNVYFALLESSVVILSTHFRLFRSDDVTVNEKNKADFLFCHILSAMLSDDQTAISFPK